jgi:hypothetical protein
LNPLPATPLPLGGRGIIISFSLAVAAAALRKASFSADDDVRNERGREKKSVTPPFSFFN